MVLFLSSLIDFLLHINWTVMPVTAITIIVVNMHRSIILKMLPLREAKDVISPTEAGIKKNAKCLIGQDALGNIREYFD